MKRACFVVQNYYDIDPRVRRKAECLASVGCHVDVIALHSPSREDNPYVLNGVNVYGIPIAKRRASHLRYLYEYCLFFFKAMFKLRQLQREMRYDLIDVNTLPDFLVFAAWPAKRRGSKIILDLHEAMPEFYQAKFEASERNLLIKLIKFQERISISYAHHVITVHEIMQDIFEQRGLDPHKATVLTNSADETQFQPYIDAQDARDKAEFLFMYHGTLTGLYSLDLAVDAFSRVVENMPDAKFWIIGDGPDRRHLKTQIKKLGLEERIRLLGQVPKDDIPELLSKADAGILPTKKDLYTELSFSNKLSEYVIMKKPVISSRLRTTRHYFREESLNYFEPGNVEELSQRIIEAYHNNVLRSSLVREALKDYEAIRWPIMRKRYIELVGKLAQN